MPSTTAWRPRAITHNLNFEGAPLFLVEYARYLTARPGWKVRVVSPADGADILKNGRDPNQLVALECAEVQ